MSLKNLILSIFLPIALVGCANAPRNYIPETAENNYPPIGQVVSAEVGEEMLVQGVLLKTKTLNVLESGHIWAYTITPGIFEKIGEDSNYEYFSPRIDPNSGTIRPISGQPDFSASIRLARATGETCILRPTDATVCGNIHFEISTITRSNPKNFQQTLLYSGKTGDIITLSYREYANEMARPSFFNDVKYDLKESKIVGYRGSRIEIINADNTKITYKVLHGFR